VASVVPFLVTELVGVLVLRAVGHEDRVLIFINTCVLELEYEVFDLRHRIKEDDDANVSREMSDGLDERRMAGQAAAILARSDLIPSLGYELWTVPGC
jgi:hypothetical protein